MSIGFGNKISLELILRTTSVDLLEDEMGAIAMLFSRLYFYMLCIGASTSILFAYDIITIL